MRDMKIRKNKETSEYARTKQQTFSAEGGMKSNLQTLEALTEWIRNNSDKIERIINITSYSVPNGSDKDIYYHTVFYIEKTNEK